jgi:hypothetical protein
MTTVCLAVMAKDEAPVIARCLASARPFVDAWVVVDTGSTDATKQVAEEAMRGVPGEVVVRPWRGFGASRTESLEIARPRADYVLVVDADDVLEAPPGARFPQLTEPAYWLRVQHGAYALKRLHLFSSRLPWRYEGVCHEYAVCDGCDSAGEPALLEGIRYVAIGGGARSRDPAKFLNDAALLEADLARDPASPRTVFYLGRSYEDGGDLPRALAAYVRRGQMGGWDEELFVAAFGAARVRERLGEPADAVERAYADAWRLRPQRAEPLAALARLARTGKDWRRARAFASAAMATPLPEADALFVEPEIYAWRAANEYAGACAALGDMPAAVRALRVLLAGGGLPAAERSRTEANLRLCEQALEVTEGDRRVHP